MSLPSTLDRQPTLLVISGSFACGKTASADALKKSGEFNKARTATTRPPREGEIAGFHYDFYPSHRAFLDDDEKGFFLEKALINNHWYGSPKATILEGLAQGKDLVVCLDPQGVVNLREERNELIQNALITIYLEASLQESIGRYLCRPGDFVREDLEKRMMTRNRDEKLKHRCHHIIKNPNGGFDYTMSQIRQVVARRRKAWETNV